MIGVDWELIVDADVNGDDDDGSDSNLDVDVHAAPASGKMSSS